MIQGNNIGVNIGGTSIIQGISLEIKPGAISVILGKNGAGKSTLLGVLSGENAPSAGEAFLENKPYPSYSSKHLADCRAVLSQSVQLAYDMPVAEVVEMGCYNHYYDLTEAERQSLIEEVVAKLNIGTFLTRNFLTLSGGEKKRVLLAKCLLQLNTGRRFHRGQQYLLLDEPTAALDLEQQYLFMELTSSLVQNENIGVVTVLHDLNLAARFADQVFILSKGKLHASGTPWETLTSDILRSTFSVSCLVQRHPELNIPLITTYGNFSTITQRAEQAQNRRTQNEKSPVGRAS